MKSLLTLLLGVVALNSPDPSHLLETYIVNLDLPPEERWVALALEKADAIHGLLNLMTPILLPHEASLELIAAVNKTMSQDYLSEMRGIAQALNLSMNEIVMANIFYEITGVVNFTGPISSARSRSCTSIVAQRSNGTVYIARNQDYPPPFSLLMIHAVFQRANKTIYEGTTYAGTIGLSTAAIFAPSSGWAVSIDARDNPLNGTIEGQKEAVAAALRGASVFPIITREACDQTSSFADAVTFLSTKELIMPGYFIIAGGQKGQGAILTRNATGNTTDVFTLFNPKGKDAGGGDWYVAQTNTDHWQPEPDYPLTNVTRRAVATKLTRKAESA